ncbi:hypothetical protein [Streptomyces lydicamycinicus]|uniref:hypothetical protein n=1 Tax=Streptomyces lydicamycinicus TaxID=1546107 RepID=UPI000ABB1036|nr:hypothetical protein [Streptomyces lydicamycinicus]
MTTMSTAFGTAVAGALVSLGGPSILGSARWLLFGFAVLCAIGIVTARAADRTSRPRRSAAAEDSSAVTQDS